MSRLATTLGKPQLSLAFLLLLLPWTSLAQTQDFSDVDQVRQMVIQRINRLWRKLSHQEWEKLAESRGGKDVRLLEEFARISDTMSEVTITPVPKLLLAPIWTYAIIQVETMGILGLYKHFRTYQKNPAQEKMPRKWQDFAENVVEDTLDTASVTKAMDKMAQLIVNEDTKANILDEIRQEVDANICNIQQSPQQILYNIYVSLQMTQLKGYTMMQFSWMLLRLYNRGNFTLEAETSRNKYVQQMKQQVQIAKETIADASTAMWRCDARKQVEDETYTKLTRLLQGYIVNEVNLNRQKSCGESCGYYSHTEQYSCYEGGFCHQQLKCEGKITDCTFVDSDMEICSTEIRSHRRYNWIKYKNGKQMGQDQTCTNVRKVDSWWRYLLWHCSYCFCLCDDARFSDRYFNLRPAISDTGLNRVVTALRFTKYNHVIHLQIQEGELLPKGLINETSVHWVPLDDYSVGKADSRPGVDYHMMSWDERALDLDDIVAPTGYVMTGVKFRKLGTHLNLEVRITPFNFTTGHLIKPHKKSEWISNDNTDGSEKPRQLLTSLASKDLDIPTRGPSENKPDSRNDTFLLFTHSSIDADVAQHTVPFFDTQQVAPNPVTPLAGAGLMHKGLPKFGGYVAPKVFTYNMADHLQSDFGDLDKNSSV
ncbi:uncharacterized protein LOC111046010 isoform X2 [Nilaparvata lugens]|uniref:uncharacterized protein LOC111046010 isoform X2 n=1 Tax=Nilaparvata lugens TaxID=108931 RepID=UPI00193DBFAD|nr:uncharacterized protein LOC111046010 isoform X2 [Nilaparvata lugens]XP_039296535.1 uncharacterized protein LOC111046010 isoform X2 [Nilaparvata lugens]XP_039296536.1 uncharacterized protein LOC111046010 isoform X2 [Nilaparvata lugens]XP_039296537.1 uncharacterized protein LOC111046010 isoform X2 [Nilaparvata lugens]